MKQKYVYALRTCDFELKGYGGFQWPDKGPVKCDDWNPKPVCGGGLHGMVWGEGVHGYLSNDSDAKWLVLKVVAKDVVYITEQGGGKWKFPACSVEFVGTRDEALAFLKKNTPDDLLDKIYGGNNCTGIQGSASATGDGGSASATGIQGSASATGIQGSASATGIQGSASATGYKGSASATGDGGSASATGDEGSASATGYKGSASATGYKGSASATGDEGTALSFHIAEAGENGTIIIKWWDEKSGRYRVRVGYVGEEGIKPETKYILNEKHEFEEVK